MIDQNPDDRLLAVLEPYAGTLTLRYLAGRRRDNSRAFNVGLAHITGDIIAFPDDGLLV